MTVFCLLRSWGRDWQILIICISPFIPFIDQHYDYTPSAFDNGTLHNAETENQGSCKVLAMATDSGFDDEQALLCFAEHYQAVRDDPEGSAHGNIRQLMRTGLKAVRFETFPLTRR